MISLPPIWPFEKIYRYLKRYYDIFVYLKKIDKENSVKYNQYIRFTSVSNKSRVKETNLSSPFLEITFLLQNFCIFNFEANSINMEIYYHDELIGSIDNQKFNLKLPRQSEKGTHLELELNQKLTEKLKTIKVTGDYDYIEFFINNVKIDFIGDKDFQNFTKRATFVWKSDSGFWLRIPMREIFPK